MKLIMENWRSFQNEEEEQPNDKKDADPKKIVKDFLAQVIKEEDFNLDEGFGDLVQRFKGFLDDTGRRAYITAQEMSLKTAMGVHGTLVDAVKAGNDGLKGLGLQDEFTNMMIKNDLEAKKTPENAMKLAGAALVIAAAAVKLDDLANAGVLADGIGEDLAKLVQDKADDIREKGLKMARGEA
jgi:hypothetical protein